MLFIQPTRHHGTKIIYGYSKNGFSFLKEKLDRTNRIKRPPAEWALAKGEKNPVNPVKPA
jgi:hypothetical protein